MACARGGHAEAHTGETVHSRHPERPYTARNRCRGSGRAGRVLTMMAGGLGADRSRSSDATGMAWIGSLSGTTSKRIRSAALPAEAPTFPLLGGPDGEHFVLCPWRRVAGELLCRYENTGNWAPAGPMFESRRPPERHGFLLHSVRDRCVSRGNLMPQEGRWLAPASRRALEEFSVRLRIRRLSLGIAIAVSDEFLTRTSPSESLERSSGPRPARLIAFTRPRVR